MSGRKQHHIPQFFLRGFGRRQKGNAIQVTVYSIHRGIFATASDGMGVQRYFYSELSEDSGVETLDDRITSYESKLAATIAEFRAAPADHAVDSTKAAEAVTHLCIRHAHMRDTFAKVVGQLMGTTEDIFSDKDRARKALGMDAQTPNNMIREELNKLYEQYGDQLCRIGITQPMFEQVAYAKAKADFEENFAKNSTFFQYLFGQLQERTDSMIRQAHNNTLEQSLAPKARVQNLERFTWSVVVGSANSFVLPDCVAVSWSAGSDYLPLNYAGQDTDIVFMPLSHDRLLKGELRKQSDDTCETLSQMFAACSYDFFIARDHTPEFEQLVPRIGERTRELGEMVLDSAAEKYS